MLDVISEVTESKNKFPGLPLGARFLVLAIRVLRVAGDVHANRLFRFSIAYLFGLFASMLGDRWAGALLGSWG